MPCSNCFKTTFLWLGPQREENSAAVTPPKAWTSRKSLGGKSQRQQGRQGREAASPLLPLCSLGPHLWEFSRELVKQRTLEKFFSRIRCRTASGLVRRLQGT